MSILKTVRVDSTPFFEPHRIYYGDTEFQGHGPHVELSATLSIRNERELWARITMDAKETQEDWTEANGAKEFLVYVETEHAAIKAIRSKTFSKTEYTDTNTEIDHLIMRSDDLVKEYECVGDCAGQDVSVLAIQHTGVRVHFRPVQIEVDDRPWIPANMEIVEFTPVPTHKFIPDKEHLISGDAEFAGHGPEITVSAGLEISDDKKSLNVNISMYARELVKDNPTIVKQSGLQSVFTCFTPIAKIISAKYCEATYRDTGVSDDHIKMGDHSLVERFVCTGDTHGPDVGVNTGVVVYFNPVKLLIYKNK